MKGSRRITTVFLSVIAAGLLLFTFLTFLFNPDVSVRKFGATFSNKYALSLGLDWKETYLAVLDELGVRHLRIPVYWDDVEVRPGRYDWTDIDWMLDEAEKRDVSVILAIGRKTPRWPECHMPEWVSSLSRSSQAAATMEFLKKEVSHFSERSSIEMWQVENEPLFLFGECPFPDPVLLRDEVAYVRSVDDRPVVLTDSGELSTWLTTSSLADVLGVSLYRRVWNPKLGFTYWPVTPRFYSDRFSFIRLVMGDDVFISELQAEPWFQEHPHETPFSVQFQGMNVEILKRNLDFASRTGADSIYLWGVEWWYWAKLNGEPSMFEFGKTIFAKPL